MPQNGNVMCPSHILATRFFGHDLTFSAYSLYGKIAKKCPGLNAYSARTSAVHLCIWKLTNSCTLEVQLIVFDFFYIYFSTYLGPDKYSRFDLSARYRVRAYGEWFFGDQKLCQVDSSRAEEGQDRKFKWLPVTCQLRQNGIF